MYAGWQGASESYTKTEDEAVFQESEYVQQACSQLSSVRWCMILLQTNWHPCLLLWLLYPGLHLADVLSMLCVQVFTCSLCVIADLTSRLPTCLCYVHCVLYIVCCLPACLAWPHVACYSAMPQLSSASSQAAWLQTATTPSAVLPSSGASKWSCRTISLS